MLMPVEVLLKSCVVINLGVRVTFILAFVSQTMHSSFGTGLAIASVRVEMGARLSAGEGHHCFSRATRTGHFHIPTWSSGQPHAWCFGRTRVESRVNDCTFRGSSQSLHGNVG